MPRSAGFTFWWPTSESRSVSTLQGLLCIELRHPNTDQITTSENSWNECPASIPRIEPTMSSPRVRTAVISRDTNETKIKLQLNLDGGALPQIEGEEQNGGEGHASQNSKSQQISIDTGIGFLDHMLHALAKHGGWSLHLRTRGDLHIDDHHTAEDSFIALGQVGGNRELVEVDEG